MGWNLKTHICWKRPQSALRGSNVIFPDMAGTPELFGRYAPYWEASKVQHGYDAMGMSKLG